MTTVFGRNHSDPHSYADVLAEWTRSENPGERAVAWNLICDHRVSREREQLLDAFIKPPITPISLQNAINDYFHREIRSSSPPGFLDSTINGHNILGHQSRIPRKYRKDLARVIDLSGMGTVYRWGRENGVKEFRDFPTNASDEQVVAWVDQQLSSRTHNSQAAVRRFVAALIVALNGQRQEDPFHPVWVTTWEAFRNVAKHTQPNRCLEALGLHRDSFPRWMIILRYKLSPDQSLVWPTQLDVGWGFVHFPSPPQAMPDCGGHPMDLRRSPRPKTLRPELIHEQIDHDLSHWDRSRNFCKRTTGPTSTDLDSLRRLHYQLLVRKYGEAVRNWMNSP